MSVGPLVVERVVPAPPDAVWAAWTTADGLAAWWWRHLPGTTYEIDAREGGRYRIVNAAAGIGVTGEYLHLDPPHGFIASWVWLDGDQDGPTERIEVGFAPHADGTAITVVHSGPWTTDAPMEAYRVGWEDTMSAFATAPLR